MISKETIEFLMENRVRNSRSWFLEHRAEYEKFVRRPLLELSERLAPAALGVDPQVAVSPVGRTISRINRDTRFSHDKSLYRDVMWCVFERRGEEGCPPGLFFEFSPDGFRYGCGYYCVPIAYMDALRELVLRDEPSYLAARRAYEKQKLFQLEGERYKRLRHPEAPAEKQDWLNRKGIAFIHSEKDFELLFSDRLAEVVADGFCKLAPLYAFLQRANERMLRR